ncbi:MAG: LiaI-LiaF-like domain-containing protein [Sphingobacteriales bacterium]
MKNDKLVPGMILVTIGAIFLLNNFGYIHFHWRNLIFMWPVFLVIGGVNLVLAHNRTPWASVLKIAVVIGGFALILFGNFNNTHWWSHATWHTGSVNINDDGDNNDSDTGTPVKGNSSGTFTQPYDASIKTARLNISGGANTFRLNDTTTELFKADTKQFHGRYNLQGSKEDSVYVLDFSNSHSRNGWNWGNDNENNIADISLNTRPQWEINIEAGATDLNFDLSKYKVKELKLSGGAGQFVVKMGQPLESTNIDVSTGASDVTIEVPENAACQIQSDTGLSSNTFDGFTKNNDGHYETANFDAAKNKIYIHISGGISDFKVHKY